MNSCNRFIEKNKEKIRIELKKLNLEEPVFFYDEDFIREKHLKLKNSLHKNWGKNHSIAISFKTNYEIVNQGISKKLNLYSEVVSLREFKLAQKLKLNLKKTIINGPNKPDSLIKIALKKESIIHLDNFDELKRAIKIIKDSNYKKYKIGIRVNSSSIGLKESRFGFDIENNDARKAIKLLKRSKITISSIHIHLGTNINNPKAYKKAAIKIRKLITDNNLLKLKVIDMGGGFPSESNPPYGTNSWKKNKIDKFVKVISQELKKIDGKEKIKLILEPGRFLVEDSAILYTKTIIKKEINRKQLITVNASNSMLPLVWYQPQEIKVFDKNLEEIKGKNIETKIYGASCQEDDLLFDSKSKQINIGNIIVFFYVGAYNQSMSSEFIYNKPKSVFIEN